MFILAHTMIVLHSIDVFLCCWCVCRWWRSWWACRPIFGTTLLAIH